MTASINKVADSAAKPSRRDLIGSSCFHLDARAFLDKAKIDTEPAQKIVNPLFKGE